MASGIPCYIRLSRWAGIDRAIALTLTGRGWSILCGPMTLFLIASHLKPEEQGFYYTFGSILGLQVFFELGLGYVLAQCVSHETADLHWTAKGILEGNPSSKSRLAALLKLSLRWYMGTAFLMVLTVGMAGFHFFSSGPSLGVHWRVPWLWLVCTTCLNFITIPICAVIEGSGLVAQAASLRTSAAVLSTVALWTSLVCRAALLANPVVNTVVLLRSTWFLWGYRRGIRDLLGTQSSASGLSWRRDIWPFQWKVSISWLSSYLIFQTFNPILFRFHGPQAAGQMGMTLSLATAPASIGVAWLSTKIPVFGKYAALRDYAHLDRAWLLATFQSLVVVVCAYGCMAVFVAWLFVTRHPYASRILPPIALGLLAASYMIAHVIFCLTTYLRAHKEDPFYVLSGASAVLIAGSSLLLGRRYGAEGICVGLFTVNLVFVLPVAYSIFLRKRKLWRSTHTPAL